ncbi:hypothetical protein J2Z82_000457 [Virgibacillus litoralis]|uniref:Uncharacterized protein n=1 Tax=Virgibacillus litoralis TaxID=578221 RepID=A0ABS4HA55_9BACI|nr:hypothetical protein [Virgibacillus litoralis]
MEVTGLVNAIVKSDHFVDFLPIGIRVLTN